ncbi:microtubule-associated protein 10 [Poecile atricapillus]|uniref:microtubule-associated protein 10 n=1 Tax=Poecile atricapillus TaxID=48891 RepID=UPI002738789E|nr:microtubule-associated protein 10 [Poecile atricapillus]
MRRTGSRAAARLSRESGPPRLHPRTSSGLSRERAPLAGMEGLFALELLVEALRMAESGPAELPEPAEHPAVALRLLDFPTLVLRPAASAPPLRPGQLFPFGRGKRCLFRWRPDTLFAALRRRPLRALLLALPAGLASGPPRLLGSCAVSLAPAAELLQRPGAPSSCGRRGRFALRDTAGRPVGELVLSYRLSSLAEASPASPRTATPPASTPEPRDDEEEEKEEEEEEEESEQLEGNVFCPPLLYYSREPAEPQRKPAAMGQWEHVEPQKPQQKDKGHSPPRPSAGPSLLHPASQGHLHNTLVQLPLLSALLAELSVLTRSAVPAAAAAAAVHPHLAWPYQVPENGDAASRSPSRSTAVKPAETPVEPGRSSEVTSPQFKQGCHKAISPGSSGAGGRPKKAVSQGQPACERNCKVKENRPPRKKLLYGLTNTLRLRLQQTNPDKLIIHERREQYRKKQIEMLRERSPLSKRKLVRNTEEQHMVSCRHCSTGGRSKRNNQLDKTVQTSLENSALSEPISVAGDVSPGLQKQSIASLSRNNSTASEERPYKITTAPLPEEIVLKSAHQEKYAKAQVPAAFPSDANAKGSYNDAIQLIHRKTMEPDDVSVVSGHKLSPSRSVENNSEFIYSDDFVASLENTVYSEDFTSAECTGRDSKLHDSSPEPLWLERLKQDRSDTEPESSRSRISKTSQRAQSTSDLVPVPSASSPVQSLRRNCDFKTSTGTSAESADSLNLAEMEASLLDEEQKAQEMSKEENRGDQHIKEISTLRSKQVKSDTDLNIGKGQTSTGQKQSVTQVSSYLPSNMSDLELSVLENSMSDKEDDFLEKLHGPNEYKDISELVINKLPGYTM